MRQLILGISVLMTLAACKKEETFPQNAVDNTNNNGKAGLLKFDVRYPQLSETKTIQLEILSIEGNMQNSNGDKVAYDENSSRKSFSFIIKGKDNKSLSVLLIDNLGSGYDHVYFNGSDYLYGMNPDVPSCASRISYNTTVTNSKKAVFDAGFIYDFVKDEVAEIQNGSLELY